jgi:hypothetical protein
MDPIISVVFSLCMYVNESLDGHMMTDGLSKCLKAKREAERNLWQLAEKMLFVMNVVKLKQSLDQTAKVT